jgi:uncharacterized protein
MILEIDPLVILIICVVFSLGGFVKGMASFGLPMMTVPLLSGVFSVPLALALTSIPILLSNVYLIIQSKMLRVTLQRFWPLISALVITMFFSTRLLLELKSNTLMFIVGCCLLFFVLSNFFRFQIKVNPHFEKIIGIFVGVASGLLGGVTSFFGLIALTYLVALKLPKEEFVAAVSTLLFTCGLALALLLANLKVLNLHELGFSIFAILPLFAGMYLGQILRGKISQHLFQRLVLVILGMLGLYIVAKYLPF